MLLNFYFVVNISCGPAFYKPSTQFPFSFSDAGRRPTGSALPFSISQSTPFKTGSDSKPTTESSHTDIKAINKSFGSGKLLTCLNNLIIIKNLCQSKKI